MDVLQSAKVPSPQPKRYSTESPLLQVEPPVENVTDSPTCEADGPDGSDGADTWCGVSILHPAKTRIVPNNRIHEAPYVAELLRPLALIRSFHLFPGARNDSLSRSNSCFRSPLTFVYAIIPYGRNIKINVEQDSILASAN